uniref:Integrin subunit beta 1 binding protein 2 n=1 Tax=Terrapene triunguis TaxID=2587831 RepID=A0A674IAK7_9SAUR
MWNRRRMDIKSDLVSCRQDWHQTSSQVVVTIYSKNPLPALSSVTASRTVIDVHIMFEGDKVFQAKLDLWGVIDVQKSFVNMVPTKVEITLRKASPMTWAKLEHCLPSVKSSAHLCLSGIVYTGIFLVHLGGS